MEVSQAEQGFETAGQLLSGSISFHYLPTSIYEARSNHQEAKYITYMLKRLLEDKVPESIGIVAFSQEQQGVIEETIEQLAATDKQFEELLEQAYNRKDDGQITGLFIKNLENVQGDERDIIIMSVCYGHDANRKMLMNFGPINRKGGEKRLNVLFSRAKKHMAVVSSIRHHHITNEYNEGANYFKRFLQYAEMVSMGNMKGATTILQGLGVGDKRTVITARQLSATTAQLKKSLEAKGYLVDENIGQSRFRCTLGVKKQSSDKQYRLGILVDDETHYHNNDLVEQYYQRPSILKAFGWRIMNVYAKDWLEDSERVLRELERVLEGKDEVGAGGGAGAGGGLVGVAASAGHAGLTGNALDRNPGDHSNSVLAAGGAAPAVPETYISPGGDRFWAILVTGNQLTIRSGKTDTKGMSQVRTFPTAAEAEAAKQAMVAEKLAEGFTRRLSDGYV